MLRSPSKVVGNWLTERMLPSSSQSGVIVAFRNWCVVGGGETGVYIRGTYIDTPWPKGQPMTESSSSILPCCTQRHPGSRAERHARYGCSLKRGVHGWRTRDECLDHFEDVYPQSFVGGVQRGMVIAGTVSLWGKVIKHERGYRAQYGYPKKLFIPNRSLDRFKGLGIPQQLRDSYGVEVDVCDF